MTPGSLPEQDGVHTEPPAIRIKGPATPGDVAAIVAVLAGVAGSGSGSGSGEGTARSARSTSAWSSRGAVLRAPVHHGPGAWRTSYRS